MLVAGPWELPSKRPSPVSIQSMQFSVLQRVCSGGLADPEGLQRRGETPEVALLGGDSGQSRINQGNGKDWKKG